MIEDIDDKDASITFEQLVNLKNGNQSFALINKNIQKADSISYEFNEEEKKALEEGMPFYSSNFFFGNYN